MTSVYISSTDKDLRDCRDAVATALRRLGVEVIGMENYVATESPPLDKCLADVADCDMYVGIFAWRYGFVPPASEKSITELEYREAQRLGKAVLIFLLDEEAPWPRTLIDRGLELERIEALRDELATSHIVNMFVDCGDLAAKVVPAVANRQSSPRRRAAGSIGADDLERYYSRLSDQYGGLDLDVLTPSDREQHLQIQLSSVFVEQNVREDAPPPDLPREFIQRLQAGGELLAGQLPEGFDAADLIELRELYEAKPLRRLLEVVAAPDRRLLVLLGHPGAGKSTAVRYLALALAGARQTERLGALAGHVPLIVELRSYAVLFAEGRCRTFLDYLDNRAEMLGLGLPKAALEPYLAAGGSALMVIDGLDEIFDPHRREEVASQVAELAARYPQVRIVVTSRIIGYSRHILANAGFTHVTLEELDERQIGDFLRSWYALALRGRREDADDRRARLLEAVRERPAIRELAGNPLLLTIIAIIGMNQELPRDRWDVYHHAAGVLVRQWEFKKNVATGPLGQEDKFGLLRRLAYRMQGGDGGLAGNYILEADLRRVFEGYLRDVDGQDTASAKRSAESMMEEFRSRDFVLSRYGPGVYGFVHRAFLEFFCASAVVQRFHDHEATPAALRSMFGSRWQDPSWREVLRLIVGRVPAPVQAKLLNELIGASPRPWPSGNLPNPLWNLALATQCLSEVRNPASVTDSAVALMDELIMLLEHGVSVPDKPNMDLIDDEILPAMRAIGPINPGADHFHRWYTRRGQRIVWSPVLTRAASMAAILTRDASRFVKTIRTMSRHPGLRPAVFPAVRELLLRTSPTADADRALVLGIAADDADPLLRQAAIRALAVRIDEPAVRSTLVARLAHDDVITVRQAVIQVLAQRAAEADVREMIVNEVRNSNHPHVRQTAVTMLGQWVDDGVIRASIEGWARNQNHTEVRVAAVRALGQRIDNRGTRALLLARVRNDANPTVRQAAVRACGEMVDDKEMRKRLLTWARSDEHPEVRESAIRALGSRIEQQAIRSIVEDKLRSDPHWNVRQAAAHALAPLVDDHQALFLDRAVHDEHPAVRQAALFALAQHLDSSTIALLIERARADDSADVRRVAVHLLGPLTEDRAVLAALLERARLDGDGSVRRAALLALGSRLDEPPVSALLADLATSDEDATVRASAVAALGDRDPALLERVARDDRSVSVRNAAWRARACQPGLTPTTLPDLPPGDTIP